MLADMTNVGLTWDGAVARTVISAVTESLALIVDSKRCGQEQ